MPAQYDDPYNDPYSGQQRQHTSDANFADPRAHYGQSYAYHDANPYEEELQYPSYPTDPSSGDYLNDVNMEKTPENVRYESTERAQPGRAGLRRPATSFAGLGPPPRSTGILRVWRKDERGKQWSRGGGIRTSLRFCCCCVTVAILMIVSIILAILLYVRPPSVALNSVTVGSDPVSLTSDGLTVSFDLSISVSNPNWFDANFKEITATARYPGNNTNTFGGGTLYNLDFKGYTESTFNFPFTLKYVYPNKVILNDLIKKCGIAGSAQDITIDYDLNMKLKILGITIDPTVSNSASFECPITASDIESIIGSSG
ncbi:hypothetical protein I308_103232 [Cryptococcus tetragattii IND107]|uniref:Late embryogenesis abundant protein LEA-2 subgroup domain-containing protein n=1 Tax=Cryptococcus tetragattii IND107 TaxID=1296105 RepID=A0ABR3BT12_9TREE